MGAGRAGWMMAALSAPLLVLPLAAGRLARRWFRAGGADQARLPGAAQGHPVAQLLGAGRLEDAMALVPAVAPHALVESYGAAFSRPAQGLAVVTAVTAPAVWACLGRGSLRQQGGAPADGGRKTGAGEGNRTLV